MLTDKLLKLTRQLYPTGRAFKMPFGGYLEGLHKAINLTHAQLWNDSVSIISSMPLDKYYDGMPFTFDPLPAGTPAGTTSDATDWERRLGLPDHSADGAAPAARYALIQAQYCYPTVPFTISNPNRGIVGYLESVLQAAGFDVVVFQNGCWNGVGGGTLTAPEDYPNGTQYLLGNDFGEFNFGQANFGGHLYSNLIANHIQEAADATFIVRDLRSTFYVAGPGSNQSTMNMATVPAQLHDQFRQLILRIKPVQTIGFLFVNYQ